MLFFFFKQKTAYEMRISDWSSDVCSSDLKVPKLGPPLPGDLGRPIVAAQQNGEIVPVPPIGQTPPDGRSLADEARERARQERESAQTSRLFLGGGRSEEHTSELQSLMRLSYAVFCLTKKKK